MDFGQNYLDKMSGCQINHSDETVERPGDRVEWYIGEKMRRGQSSARVGVRRGQSLARREKLHIHRIMCKIIIRKPVR